MAEIPPDLQAALASRYDLQRVLGRGGMAAVYLADDRKHRRQVAIKVLRPDLAASIGAERFLIEIEIAARLTHPHILPLHDSGEAGGFLYYVMPFIDGGSLRTRLEHGRLEPAAMLGIAAGIAGALAYAHRMNVVHRDIKPENILFAQGLPIVADFGIAKAISTAGGEQLTRTGFPLGTPGYMSPEQAAGLTDLDVRTDVYALAVVCYEMLVGAVPGRWPTEDAVRSGRFLEAPASHRAILDTLPAAFEPALVRAMAIRHDQRTATADELIAQMRATDSRWHRSGERPAVAPPSDRATVPRAYSRGEVDDIVKRAAEMEVSQPTIGGSMTIGGIQQVAAEAGIDPSMVSKAAAFVRPGHRPIEVIPQKPARFSAAWFAGGPTKIVAERVVLGELTESDCAYLVEETRVEVEAPGIISTLGKTVSWVTQRTQGSTVRDVQVSLTMRGGQTRIVIREGLGPMAGAIFGGIGGGVGGGGLGPMMAITVGGLHLPWLAAILGPAWAISVMATARSVYHYRSRARQRDIEKLADRLAGIATSLIADAAPQGRLAPG